MSRKAATPALCLTEEVRATLSALARSRTAPAHHAERSAIILHLADRRDATEIAATLHIDRQRVTRCVHQVMAVGPLKAIDDLPRLGRRPEITEAARTWLIGEACVKAKERGYPHELWTLRLLAAHAREHGPTAGHACLAKLAPSTVHEILNSRPLKRKHPPSAAVLHGRRPSMRTTHWCRLPLEVREEFLEVLDTFGGKGNGGHFVDVPDGEDTVFRLHIEGDVAQEVLVLAEHLGHPADGGDGTGRRH